jgi:hypothetical protein
MSNVQPVAAQQALNPQPQTTGKPPTTIFTQQSFAGNVPQYATSYSGAGGGFGSTITTALVGASGYYRRLRVKVTATGGTGGTTAKAAADGPYNCIQQVILRDAASNVNILNLDGYFLCKILPIVSGAHGIWKYADPAETPYYSGLQTATGTGCGDFQFMIDLPMEFANSDGGAVGVIGADNTSVQPGLTWTLAPTGTVYATAPATLPTLNLQVDADFWWNPSQPGLLPEGLGSSRQYGQIVGTPGVSNGSSQIVSFPKAGGGYWDTLTFVMRDSLGVRTDTGWPSRLQLYIDNTAYMNIDLDELIDDMYAEFQFPSNSDPRYNGAPTADVAGARPVGVLIFSFRNLAAQVDFGLDQSGLNYIATTPGTSLQLGGTGWQNVNSDANTPYTISCYPGLIVPAGSLLV